MGDLISSFSKWLSEKTNSPLYWTYFGFFIAWNWRFFQVIFLEDAVLFSVPRIEYLDTLLLSPIRIVFFDFIINFVWRIGPPAILTYIAIAYLPHLHKWAFEIYSKNHFERKTIFQRQKAGYEQEIAKLTKQEAEAVIERIAQEKIIKAGKTQEEKWNEDLAIFESSEKNIKAFISASRIIYEVTGEFVSGSHTIAHAYQRYISSDDLSLLDAFEVIEISRGEYGQKMAFTQKGKFFLKKLKERKQI